MGKGCGEALDCEDCGAHYEDKEDSCAHRFGQLLALDHSRQEPWGSRHGLAFAVFALQHPCQYGAATRARGLELLERVFLRQEPTEYVLKALRARGSDDEPTEVPSATGPFTCTMVDCGSVEARAYAVCLEIWCRVTFHDFGADF